MAAETAVILPDTCFHCCSKCKGLFGTSADHMKHQVICNGNPFKCASMYFACERKIFLQLFQSEDFQTTDGSFSLANFSKDDSFLDHVVKIRMPQDNFDPSIFLRSNTSSLQPTLQDSEILINPNSLEPEVNKTDQYLQDSKSRYAESIEQDQLRTIINKNIDYLKSDDIPSLTSPTSKELHFTHSHSEPRLLSPIEKDFLPDVSKSRVQSPFEKCVNYLQEIGSAYPTTSLAYPSNQSIPFSCNLSTDLLGGLASTQEETMTSVDDLPTLQYLDLAKKDIFFGQNPGLSQMNTKDPFLINATVKPDRPISAGPRYPCQPSKSCEDLQASPTFPLQDGNYFNFPSTLDEPTQLDYLDLATLDFLTNPTTFSSYGLGMHRDRSSVDRDDIYSECNFLFHEKSNHSPDDGDKLEKKSFEDNVKLTKSKIKRIRLKKVKRGIQKKNKGSNVTKIEKDVEEKPESDKGRIFEALTDTISKRSSQDKKRFKRTYSAEYEPRITPSLTRKRKLMSSHDTLNFRISPDAKKKVKAFDRKFNETQRLCPTNAILNVKDSLFGYTDEEKDSMTAVFGQLGCIVVKKQKSVTKTSMASDHVITKVPTGLGENKLFVLEGKTLQTYENCPVSDIAGVQAVSPIPANSNTADNVKSVLMLKCQYCIFTTTSVTEFKSHNGNHEMTESVNGKDREFDFTSTSVENSVNKTMVSNVIEDKTRHSNTNDTVGLSFTRNQEYSVSNVSQNSETNINESVLEFCEQKISEIVTDTRTSTPGYDKIAVFSKAGEPNTGMSVYDGIVNKLQPPTYESFNSPSHSRESVETIIPLSAVSPNTNNTVEMSACRNTSDNIFSVTETLVGLNFEDDYPFSNSPYTKVEASNNATITVGTDSTSCLSSMDNVCTLLQHSPVSSAPEQGKTASNRPESFDEAQLACNILQQEVLSKMISETEDTSQDLWTNLVSEPFVNVVIPDTLPEDKVSHSHACDKDFPFCQKDMAHESLEPAAIEQRQSARGNIVEAMSEVFIYDQHSSLCKEHEKTGEKSTSARQTDGTREREVVDEQIDIKTVPTDTDHTYDIYDRQVEDDIEQELKADIDSSVSKNAANDLEVGMTLSCNLVTMASSQEHVNSETSTVLASNAERQFHGIVEHNKINEEPFGLSDEITIREDDHTLRVDSMDKAVQCSESEDFEIYTDTDTDEIGTCIRQEPCASVEQSEGVIDESEAQQASPKLVKLPNELTDRGKVNILNDHSKGTETSFGIIAENRSDKDAKSNPKLQHTVSRSYSEFHTVEMDHCYCRELRKPGHESVPPSYRIVTEQPTASESSSISTDHGLHTNDQSLLKAKAQKTEGALLSCSVSGCSFKTALKKNLNAHLTRHNSEHKLLCDQCAFTTTDVVLGNCGDQ